MFQKLSGKVNSDGTLVALLLLGWFAVVVLNNVKARELEAVKRQIASPSGQATLAAMGEAQVAWDMQHQPGLVQAAAFETPGPAIQLLKLLEEGVPVETASAMVKGSGRPVVASFEIPKLKPPRPVVIDPEAPRAVAPPGHPCAQLWWPEIVAAGQKHRVDPLLILEFMGNESACREAAVSPVGAQGLMQIMPATGKEIAPRCGENAAQVWEPGVNISLGACYIRMMADLLRGGKLSSYDDVFWVAVAYNSGPGRAQSGTVLPETGPYANAIASAYTGGR